MLAAVKVLNEWHALGLVVIAAILGGAMGIEREITGKAAGLRTHMLVAGACALAITVSRLTLEHSSGDSTRTLHAVITGIGFLGAGTILHHQSSVVKGLTSAASLFFAAIVGATVGSGLLLLAAGGTVISLATLALGRVSEYRRGPHPDDTSEPQPPRP